MNILTFGCFNIVHPGHFDLFRLSKALAPDGRLIVAIAADKVVRVAKEEIIYSLRDKMDMIMGCRYVDEIDVYGDELNEDDLNAPMSYADHLEMLHAPEQACAAFHNADIITFGADKHRSDYYHINNKGKDKRIRLVQLPRLSVEKTSSEFIRKIRETHD